jgi:hypothetical protein
VEADKSHALGVRTDRLWPRRLAAAIVTVDGEGGHAAVAIPPFGQGST